MTQSEEMLQSLVDQAVKREKMARRRALIYSLVPILLAAALVAFTGWQVAQANLKLLSINNQVADLNHTNQQLAQDQVQLKATNSDLTSANQDLASQNQDLSGKLAETQGQLTDTQKQLATTQNLLETQKKDLVAAQQQTTQLTTQVASLQAQITNLDNQLKLATRFQTFKFRGSWEETVKSMYNRPISQQVPDLLSYIIQNETIPWKVDGTNPKDGFNSPRFAAYVLQQMKLVDVDPAKIQTADDLMKLLKVRRVGMQDGDVVFYPQGYVMFYFTDESGRPFVAGMTPLGVQVLDAGFANPTGVATVIGAQ